jgi:large subunit ribosomal protein L24
MKMKIKKEDTVQVISGNDKGKKGRVLEVYPKNGKLLVEGISVHKKHMRPNQQNSKGGIISKEMPIDYSNVMLVDSDGNPTRIEIKKEDADGRTITVRYAKTNGKKLN